MSYKIVVDSCCELPDYCHKDDRYEIVPLTLEVEEEQIIDDESFDQASFLQKVAASPKCPRSSCPSPERYRESYVTEAENVFVFTLSSKLSGSYTNDFYDIINEESTAYFKGEKTAQEAADIIQNRISILVSEQS